MPFEAEQIENTWVQHNRCRSSLGRGKLKADVVLDDVVAAAVTVGSAMCR